MRAFIVIPALSLLLSGAAPPQDEVELRFSDCDAQRPALLTGVGDLVEIMLRGPPVDPLVLRATMKVEEREVAIYLPKAPLYSRENRGSDSTGMENSSTLLSIDDDGDGVLTERESWHANLPLRIGDTMFDVVELAADGRRMVVRRSTEPLSGIVVGRRVPPFELRTASGQTFSDASLAGKPFVLDLWSVT